MKIDNHLTPPADIDKKTAGADQIAQKRQAAADKPAESKQVPPEEILKTIKQITEDGDRSVRFEMDDETNTLVVRVVDKESGDVVRQIPAEEVLGARRALQDLSGLLIDTQS